MRRDMANRNHRLQAVKLMQPHFQLFLGILPWRVEWRRIRVAQTNHVEPADLDPPPVKVVQPESGAQIRNLPGRFMVARNYIYPAAPLLQNFAHGVETARKIHQIPGAEIIVRLDRHQPVERPRVAMDIREYQQFHRFILQAHFQSHARRYPAHLVHQIVYHQGVSVHILIHGFVISA